MGNAESQLTPPSSTRSIPVPIPSRENKTIISESPVAGSPLQIAGSIDSYTEKKVDIPPSPPRISRKDNFIQPAGEKPYKNSSKIIHQFGSLGLAPLQPIGTVKKNIPVMIVWSHAGQVVHLTGSFNNWKRKIRLTKSTEDFTTIVDMPPGKHSLKFIVDDEWKCSEDLPVEEDQDGNLVNYISVNDEEGRSVEDGLQDISDDFGMEKVESYLCNLPLMRSDKQPPSLPAQLQKVLLNSKSITQDDPYILPVPNHVSLNHLYACSIRDGVMAISSGTLEIGWEINEYWDEPKISYWFLIPIILQCYISAYFGIKKRNRYAQYEPVADKE
ncbi:hypothetical protein HDV04_005216 [Boothiomyces sp. JEL0838]|nr:hypothetical protein HDV04_005216 [Boothiomyces sp. JEL0838]